MTWKDQEKVARLVGRIDLALLLEPAYNKIQMRLLPRAHTNTSMCAFLHVDRPFRFNTRSKSGTFMQKLELVRLSFDTAAELQTVFSWPSAFLKVPAHKQHGPINRVGLRDEAGTVWSDRSHTRSFQWLDPENPPSPRKNLYSKTHIFLSKTSFLAGDTHEKGILVCRRLTQKRSRD